MKKITVISGPRNSGKTFLSKNISLAFENPCFLDVQNFFSTFGMSVINENTDLIVIDEVAENHLETIAFIFSEPKLIIPRQAQKPLIIDTPKTVIVTNSRLPKGSSFTRRVNIVQANRNLPEYMNPVFFDFKKIDL